MIRVAAAVILLASFARAATLTGIVTDEAHHAVKSARISVRCDAAGEIFSAETKADGAFVFATLPDGTCTVRAEASGFAGLDLAPFFLGPKEAKKIDLTLHPLPEQAFFDPPKYVVSGVTAGSYQGGHGSDVVLRSSEELARAASALGNAPETRGDALAAVREYERAAGADPSEDHLFEWGAELLRHQAYEPAIDVFGRGSKLFPASMRMRLGLGAAHYANGAYEQAAGSLFAACDLKRDDPRPYLLLEKIRADEITGMSGFVERMSAFATMHPEMAEANFAYARALSKRHEDPATVRELLTKALGIDAKLSGAWLLLGALDADDGNLSEAIRAFQKAVDANPAGPEAHYRLAQAYRRAGEFASASKETVIYNGLSKKEAADVERDRREVQRFVYSLRAQ